MRRLLIPQTGSLYRIENKNTGNQNNTNTQTVTTKAEVAGIGEVSTPVTDSSSYFGKGRLTLLANHDTAAQQLAAIIETGEGGLIVVDGGWTDNTDYVLNQIKAKATMSGMADYTS